MRRNIKYIFRLALNLLEKHHLKDEHNNDMEEKGKINGDCN